MSNQCDPGTAAPSKSSQQPSEAEKGAERRSEIRYPAQEPAELEILPDGREPIYAMILDISRSGLRVAVPQRIDRGAQIKVQFQRNVIFGEVRYCRSVSGTFQAGIRIQDLLRPPGADTQHIEDESLSLYLVGKGLSIAESIEIRNHLAQCEACRGILAKKEAVLNPKRRFGARRSLSS